MAARRSVPKRDAPASGFSDAVVLETVRTDGLAHLSYLIGDRARGHAAVIDPRRDVDVYVELANKHGLTITHAAETHTTPTSSRAAVSWPPARALPRST
jgi:hypothetical protein